MIEAKPEETAPPERPPQSREESSASAPARPGCAVKLPVFEGPLDLLLHLIRTNEVDVSDIPIALISEQYLEYLELMRILDVDVASDYLVMAATLAHIKSRMLLPTDSEGEEDGEGEDPRAELARRLAAYAVFQEAARDLGGRPLLGRDVFPVTPDRSELPEPEPVLSVSLYALLDAMKRVLERISEESAHHEILRESLTVQDRMLYVMDRLRAERSAALLFEDLLLDTPVTRHRVVVTFLAILELAKMRALRIFQHATERGAPVGPVRVRLAVGPDPPAADPA